MCWLCWEVFVSKSYASRVLELSDENSADKKDLKIDAALDKLKQTRTVTPEKQSMFANWKEFRNPELYKPFAIMVAFFAIQQFSGIFVNANVFLHVISSNCFLFQVIFIYAAQFSLEAGVAIDEFLSAVIIGVIRCVTTIMVAFVADKVGKKPLTIVSASGMFLCMLGLTLCAAFPLTGTNFQWLPTVLLFMYIFTGTFGILTFPFAMVAEMYPQKSRGFAAGITMFLAWAMSFAVIKTFSTVFEVFGSTVVFSFYAIVSLIGIMFGVFVLPETKGKTFAEIEEIFKRRN